MSKKILFTIVLAIALIFSFSMSICLATDGTNAVTNAGNDLVNGVRDAVGGAENAMEDVVNGAGNAMQNTMNDANNMMNENNQNTNGAIDYMRATENTTGNYSATRTNTRTATGTNNTFLGMTTNAWTWLIIAAVALSIIDYLIVKFTGLHASPFGKGFVGFALAAITLYVTQFFVAGYSISWIAAIIGALIYGVVDYFLPGNQSM